MTSSLPFLCTAWLTLVAAAPAAQVDRDAAGIPSIVAADRASLMQAHGRAVADDRLWQLEMSRRAARGELAAAFGPALADADREVRRQGYTEAELQQQFERLPAAVRADLLAYGAGINLSLEARRSAGLPWEFGRVGLAPRPWRVTDSIALGAFLLRRFGEVGGQEVANLQLLQRLVARHGDAVGRRLFDDLRWTNEPAAPTTIAAAAPRSDRRSRLPNAAPLGPRQRRLQARVTPDATALAALWQRLGVVSRLGSFAFAVAPQPARGVGALLYGGPQMRFSVPNIVYEVGLQAPDLKVRGMVIPGIPWVLIGSNAHLAWTTTSGKGDNLDLYVETLCQAPGGRLGSKFHGTCEALERRREVVEVAGQPPAELEVWRSRHGPLQPFAAGDRTAVAVRRQHWQREVEALGGFYAMGQANDLPSFAAAMPHFVTSHNFLYADRAGNVAYWQAGEVPERPPGSDFRLPLPGDGSAEPTGRYLPLPQQQNPPDGLLANWNNKAWEGADSSDNWYGGEVHRVVDLQTRLRRAKQAQQLDLAGLVDVVADIARTDHCGTSFTLLGEPVLAAVAAAGAPPLPRQQALGLLRPWSGLAVQDARQQAFLEPASVLWTAWMAAFERAAFAPLLGDDLGPLSPSLRVRLLRQRLGVATPGSLPVADAWPDRRALTRLLVQTLDGTLQALRSRLGDDPTQWRVPRPKTPLEHPLLGKVGEMWLANRATYGMAVEATAAAMRLQSTFAPGESGEVEDRGGEPHPGPHLTDLLEDFAAFCHRPVVELR